MARIADDRVTLSIDSSGDLLHRRGYRKAATKAPLRETLAAGALMLLDWAGEEPLADPMCGSGTFLLEGALLASNRAPGLSRSFAFMQWPGYREGLWKLLCEEARRSVTVLYEEISGADENADAVSAAHENCHQCGYAERVLINQLALEKQQPHKKPGLVISNPPYGRRLSLGENPEEYYAELGKQLKRVFPGWRKVLICPDETLIEATGLAFKKVATLDNGGLKVGLFVSKE